MRTGTVVAAAAAMMGLAVLMGRFAALAGDGSLGEPLSDSDGGPSLSGLGDTA